MSADGSRVFLGDQGQVRVQDIRARIELESIRFTTTRLLPGAPAVSPEVILAVTLLEGRVTLWDSQTGRLLHTAQEHRAAVGCAAFSPDGSRLATASSGDTQVKLWNLETQQEILTITGFGGRSFQVFFASDGSGLAAQLAYGRAQIWWVPSFEEIAATEAREKAESKQR